LWRAGADHRGAGVNEGRAPRGARAAGIAVVLLTIALGLRVCGAMWQEAPLDQGFQMYDNNAHAIDGVRMADDLRRGAFGNFLAHVNARTVWPPLMPLLEVPGFLMFGVDQDTAERQMVVVSFLMILAAAAAGLALGGLRGVLTAAGLVALIASSPFCTSFMIEIMMEGPAALLWLLSMAFYARWVRHERAPDRIACCLCGFALFMLKFNFGLLWALPVMIHELWRTGTARVLPAALWGARTRVRPLWLAYATFVVLAALVLLARLLDRGWGAEGLSHGVAHAGTHGLLVPVLVVAGFALLPFAIRPRATGHAVGALWLAAGPFGRAFLALVALPTARWFAVPTHAKGLLHFLAGRVPETPMWSAEWLLYYPRVFLFEYSAAPWIGVTAFALALTSIVFLPRLRGPERVLPIALVINLVLVTLHPVKGDRYFYTIAPVVWMSAALGLAVVAEALGRRLQQPLAAAALAPLLLAWPLALGPDMARVRAQLEIVHMPASLVHVLDDVVDAHVASNGSVLFGTWNRLAPPLVEWHQRLRYPEDGAPPRPLNPAWFGTDDPARLLQRIASDPGIERVIVLDLRPGFPESSPAFELENGWQAPVRAALGTDPRFVMEQQVPFDDTGYAMTVYRKGPAPGARGPG
jgi:hypothetical protein